MDTIERDSGQVEEAVQSSGMTAFRRASAFLRNPWNKASLLLFAALLCLYALTMSESFTSRNSGEGFMRIGVLENLLNHGRIAIGEPDDKWGSPGMWGFRYSWHEFGQNLFVLPLYYFIRDSGFAFYIVNAAFTALTAVFILQICRLTGIRQAPSFTAAFAYGAGTLAWFYGSKVPHEHAIAVLTLVAALYYLMRYQMGHGRKRLIECVVCLGFGFITRHDVIIGAVPLIYYLFSERDVNRDNKFPIKKALLISALVFLPFLYFTFHYNYYRFGNIFETGRAAQIQEKHWALEFVPRGLIGALLSPGRSIFIFSPMLLLFPFSLKAFFKKAGGRLFAVFVSTIIIYLLFYSLHHSWDGEWCFGPRYHLVLLPFMTVSIAAFLESVRHKRIWIKAAVVCIIVLGILSHASFSASNWWLSNVMKYGVDDDFQVELNKATRKSFGPHGSWEWLWSFFPLKYAQPFNQHKLTWLMLKLNANPGSRDEVMLEIYWSEYWYLMNYIDVIETPDYWWLQRKSPLRAASASALGAVFIIASVAAFRISRRED